MCKMCYKEAFISKEAAVALAADEEQRFFG
jgi:hypothetical protein